MTPWEEGEALHDILAEIIYLKREENSLCQQPSEHPSFKCCRTAEPLVLSAKDLS